MDSQAVATVNAQAGRELARAGRAGTLLAACAWLNLLALLGVWALFRLGGDRWWFATLLLFGPRWVYLLPTILLVPVCVLMRSLPALPLALGILVGLFPLMGLNLGWSRAGDPQQPPFRVLTYNIQRYSVTEQDFARLLATVQPDVAAVQESAGWVPGGWHVPEGWYVERAEEMLVASRWPIRRTERSYFRLPGDERGVVNAMYCVLDTPTGPIGLCNLHLDTPRRGLSAVLNRQKILDLRKTEYAERRIALRRQESQDVARWLSSFPEPKIIAGDFNMPIDSRIYRAVWARYRNAFNRAGFGFGYTKQTVIRGWQYGLRIDHVLTDDHWKATRCWVGPDLGADHLPVIAEVAAER